MSTTIKEAVWQAKLEDDSESIKKYYQKLFANYKNKEILNALTEVMNAWSQIVRSGEFSPENQALFEKALRYSHEYVWYEAGSRLAKLIPYSQDAKSIFLRVFRDTRWKSRFNIVALSGGFDDRLAYKILSEAVNDKSVKVREKVADVVLIRQDRHFLELLEGRLGIEKAKSVVEAINFTIKHFDRVRRDEHGNLILHSNDVVEWRS